MNVKNIYKNKLLKSIKFCATVRSIKRRRIAVINIINECSKL
jgi:hypothetical protein